MIVPSALKTQAGSKVTVKTQAFTGYQLHADSLKATAADGTIVPLEAGEEGVLSFVMPAQAVTLSAAFDAQQYPVTLAEGITGGSLELSVQGTAAYRQTVTVTVRPQEGRRLVKGSLKALLADGGTLALDAVDGERYEFVMPAQAVTLQAAFEAVPDHTVTVESTGSGTAQVTASGVQDGGSIQIRMQPEEGSIVGSIAVNGQPWPVPAQGNELTIENVTSDLAVAVEFVSADTRMHTVAAAAGEGGTVVPERQLVKDGGSAVVIPKAQTGYMVEAVKAGEQSAQYNETNGTWLLNGVTADLNVQVSFVKNQYAITLTQPEHGTLSASASAAGLGDTVTVTVQPAEGYRFEDGSLRVTGEDGAQQSVTAQEAGKSYSFRMPGQAVQVTGTFVQVEAPAPSPDPNPDPEPTAKPQPSPAPTQAPDQNPRPDPTAAPAPAPTAAPTAAPAPTAVPPVNTSNTEKKPVKATPAPESESQSEQSDAVTPTAAPTPSPENSTAQSDSSASSVPVTEANANKNPMPVILVAGGAVLLAAVLGIVLWKMKANREE